MLARRRHTLALMLSLSGLCAPAMAGPQSADSRVIHEFDFDERGAGNVELLPRYWSPLFGAGFPRFTNGEFDDAVGRTASPSLRIESLGRNVVYHYHGPEIPVRADSSYRIEGFVRLAQMTHARACVGVHFLDESKNPLTQSTRRTSYLAPQAAIEWLPFEVHLSNAPPEAKFLGLSVWILQEEAWNTARDHTGISLVDVAATAWFDDITVFRLPHVQLTTRRPGEIVEEGREQTLWVSLADAADMPIAALIKIVTAGGTEILARRMDFTAEADPVPVDLSTLAPGAYDARVEVVERDKTIVSRTLRFLKQPRLDPGRHGPARSFGIVIDSHDASDLPTQSAMLGNHAARSVKLPLSQAGDRTFERHCDDLASRGFLLTALISAPAASPNAGFEWVREFAGSAPQTAGLFRGWQIGSDAEPLTATAGAAAAPQLRKSLEEYLNSPRLALPASLLDDPAATRLPVEQVTLPVTSAQDLFQLPQRIESLKTRGYDEVAAFVPSLPGDFDRPRRMAEWTQRVLAARHAGADTVFIPQPWRAVKTQHGSNVAPDEEYLLFCTMAAMIGDARPGPALACGDGVSCLTFQQGEHSVVAIWDAAPPPGGRSITFQLGNASHMVDLWGRSTPLSRDASRQVIPISPFPVFVDGVDTWVVDFATSMTIEPAVVESGNESIRHEIVIHCRSAAARVGSGVLMPADGIVAAPRRFDFISCAGEPVRIPVEIRYPHNEPAGRKVIVAKIKLEDPEYTFEIPLAVEVRTTDLEVFGRATLEGGDLLLRHVVHNSSQTPASFRSIADVPGRQRQYRPVTNLSPGSTQTIEFRFRDATQLVGRSVNLGLRELNDGARKHNLQLVVP